MRRSRVFGILIVVSVVPAACDAQLQRIPSGYQQLLPRGGIAAITEPAFVSAARAGISPNAWVLGVELDGVAHAYSLSLLNSHEVVNDQIAGTAFAAVW